MHLMTAQREDACATILRMIYRSVIVDSSCLWEQAFSIDGWFAVQRRVQCTLMATIADVRLRWGNLLGRTMAGWQTFKHEPSIALVWIFVETRLEPNTPVKSLYGHNFKTANRPHVGLTVSLDMISIRYFFCRAERHRRQFLVSCRSRKL